MLLLRINCKRGSNCRDRDINRCCTLVPELISNLCLSEAEVYQQTRLASPADASVRPLSIKPDCTRVSPATLPPCSLEVTPALFSSPVMVTGCQENHKLALATSFRAIVEDMRSSRVEALGMLLRHVLTLHGLVQRTQHQQHRVLRAKSFAENSKDKHRSLLTQTA